MRANADAGDFSVGAPTGPQSPGPLFEEPTDGVFTRSHFKPTTAEIAIGSLIWKHKGWKNPISIAKIIQTASIVGLDERAVKQTVADLVVMHRCRIGANRDNRRGEGGYFWIVDAEDLEAAVRPFRKQMIEMGKRLRVLMSQEDYQDLVGQLRLEGDQCD